MPISRPSRTGCRICCGEQSGCLHSGRGKRVRSAGLPLISHASRDSFPPQGEASRTERLPLAGEGAPRKGADEVESCPFLRTRPRWKRGKFSPHQSPSGDSFPPEGSQPYRQNTASTNKRPEHTRSGRCLFYHKETSSRYCGGTRSVSHTPFTER